MRALKTYALGVVALLALLACKKDNKVWVECVGTGQGFNCSATHQQGNDKVNACWDIKVVCQNGTVASGHGCQVVGPNQKSSTLIPVSQIQNADKCDLAKTTSVENLTLNVVP
jgi:hypothetical protein